VFVVGLSTRLADPEVLKKHEYFGKFGKIHKVVINQSTSYAGAQVKMFFNLGHPWVLICHSLCLEVLGSLNFLLFGICYKD
jgi:hypothetical protein